MNFLVRYKYTLQPPYYHALRAELILMDNIVGLLIGVMVCIIILYNVTLPTVNTSVYGSSAANLTATNLSLTTVIPTLLITTVVVYVVRGMLA